MTGTNVHDPKPVRATEVLLYILDGLILMFPGFLNTWILYLGSNVFKESLLFLSNLFFNVFAT